MKVYVFSGEGVQSQSYSYSVSLTAQELANDANISVEEVEAMTEEQIAALVQDNMFIIDDKVYQGGDDVELSWGDSECSCESDFDLDIEEVDEE